MCGMGVEKVSCCLPLASRLFNSFACIFFFWLCGSLSLSTNVLCLRGRRVVFRRELSCLLRMPLCSLIARSFLLCLPPASLLVVRRPITTRQSFVKEGNNEFFTMFPCLSCLRVNRMCSCLYVCFSISDCGAGHAAGSCGRHEGVGCAGGIQEQAAGGTRKNKTIAWMLCNHAMERISFLFGCNSKRTIVRSRRHRSITSSCVPTSSRTVYVRTRITATRTWMFFFWYFRPCETFSGVLVFLHRISLF